MALTAADPGAELLTKSDAAALLKVSPVTVSRWLKQDLLPAYRLGRRAIRIRRGDIERMLAPIHLNEQRADPAADLNRQNLRFLSDRPRALGIHHATDRGGDQAWLGRHG
jgi:excisionase family DNA binding protein